MARIKGGCLCGRIRYASEADPVMQVACHCKSCRSNTGSAFSLNIAMPADQVEVTGDPATYEDRSGASGLPFSRVFCPACGSPIMGHGPAYGPLVFLKAGTLDDDAWVAPTAHIWCAEKLGWTPIPDGEATYEGNPG